MTRPRLALKIGGSLFDFPDLGTRLRTLFASLEPAELLLIPGGGAAADVIRTLDRTHKLGDEASHWLALHAMTLNAHFLARLLPEFTVTAQVPPEIPRAIMDGCAFALQDELQPEPLPHRWEVSSDSLAARIAKRARAQELILVKSRSWEGTWEDAAAQKVVDAFFPREVKDYSGSVRCVNLRS